MTKPTVHVALAEMDALIGATALPSASLDKDQLRADLDELRGKLAFIDWDKGMTLDATALAEIGKLYASLRRAQTCLAAANDRGKLGGLRHAVTGCRGSGHPTRDQFDAFVETLPLMTAGLKAARDAREKVAEELGPETPVRHVAEQAIDDLATIFEQHFERPAGRSRGSGEATGPFVRFACCACKLVGLGEVAPETVARYLKRSRADVG